MATLHEMMKAEYKKMDSESLQGVLRQGKQSVQEYIRSLAPEGHPEELIEQGALEMIADINAELRSRGKG